MFYSVERGVDCFEVGIQQLLDFMGWKSNVRDDGWIPVCGLGSGISCVAVDDYVVVRTACEFGSIHRPFVTGCFSNFTDAVDSASLLTMVEYDCMLSRSDKFDMYFVYEVWHVMDDGDLWQAWDYDSELSRVDAPVLLDERDIDGVELDHEQLWSLNIPGVGPVSFLWYLRRGELVEEYCITDWQSEQPRRLKGVGWYVWLSVEDMLACIDSLEQLRAAGSLDVGGRVGADC